MAEKLAQAGMQLAIERDLDACAHRLVKIAVELEFAERAAFVGHGDIHRVTAGDVDNVPAGFEPTDSGAALGDVVGRVGAWLGVHVGDVSGEDRSWGGTLWACGIPETAESALGTLAQQAGVAFMVVREREQQHASQRHQRALVEAGKSLARHHDVDALLHHIVELATTLVGARYGALGVVDETGQTLDRFLTVGIDDETRARIGELPKGRGILGVLIHDPRPLRLASIQDDPRSSGFPPHHPPMKSFLGVPITTRGTVKGRLYLTEKHGADEFSPEDEELAVTLASQAGIALENAELYTALVEANSELEIANRHKSSFLASMSHELRSPLNTIIGYTQLLLDAPGNLDEDQLEDLAIIQSSGRHLLALISDLLDLSKIEAGKIELRVETTDAVTLLDEAVSAVRPQLHPGVVLTTSAPEGPLMFDADPDRVRQMLLNVLGNAAKFTTDGTIRASIEASEDDLRFVIADDGPGIPEADLEHLFESFYQSQSALQRTPREHEGAGLGLAITQRLASLHRGSVQLQSALGSGTTVTIELPIGGPAARRVWEVGQGG